MFLKTSHEIKNNPIKMIPTINSTIARLLIGFSPSAFFLMIASHAGIVNKEYALSSTPILLLCWRWTSTSRTDMRNIPIPMDGGQEEILARLLLFRRPQWTRISGRRAEYGGENHQRNGKTQIMLPLCREMWYNQPILMQLVSESP